MKETIEFMSDLNWFLKPVSDILIWAFTTTSGIITLSTLLALYVIITLINAVYKRKIVIRGSSSYSSGHVSGFEKLYIIISEFLKICFNLIAKVPVLLGIIIFFVAVIGISKSFDKVENFINAEKKVKQLNSLISQLDKRYKVADLEVTDMTFNRETGETTTKLKIDFYDYTNTGKVAKTQNLTLKGYDIYVDAMVINFDYSTITSGKRINLTLPYRIFSNEVPMEEGIKLDYSNEEGIPLIFNRNETEIYAMPADSFNVRLKEILNFATDKEKAQKFGVRSFNGNAVHKRLRKGQKETIWIEQSGGIVMRSTGIF